MSKKLKILLVEDDKKFGESLAKILAAEGFECIHAEKPQTALSLCKVHAFDIAIIDCMLPQMNGVDLALKIKETVGSSLILYMMSGIYKDRNFSVTALKKTGAKSFLIKPFEMTELVRQLKSDMPGKDDSTATSDDPLKNILLSETSSSAVFTAALNAKKTISGFEIPQIINLALILKVVGRIQLRTTQKTLDLFFNSDGLYCTPPPQLPKVLREHLVSREYVAPEDLAKIKDSELSLQGLCMQNMMSPHFAEMIQKELIQDELNGVVNLNTYTVEFTNAPTPNNLINIDRHTVDDLIQNWISSSINPVWLKNYYFSFMHHALRKHNTSYTKLQYFPIISAHKVVLSHMASSKNLIEVIGESGVNEDTVYKIIHMMLIYREYSIAGKKIVTNIKSQAERLKNLLKSFENQNSFEKLGLQNNATDMDIKKSHQEFSSTLHPDKLLDAPDEIKKISLKVYEQVQEAYNNIKTPEKRMEYLKLLERQKLQQQADANRVLDQALLLLLKGDLSSAENAIAEANILAPHLPRLKVLQAWAGLKTNKLNAQVAGKLLQALTTDERETAVYHYVKGLQNLAAHDIPKAEISFKNAIAKDTNFLPARRELSALPQQKGPVNIFNADIKDVVGLFFKKK